MRTRNSGSAWALENEARGSNEPSTLMPLIEGKSSVSASLKTGRLTIQS